MPLAIMVRTPPPVVSGSFTPNANFSVSGSFADGGVLTITDSAGRLGNKPNGALPLLFFDYAGGTLTPKLPYSREVTGYSFSAGNSFSNATLPPNAVGACACDMTVFSHTSGPQVTWNDVSNAYFYRNVWKYYSWSPGVATNYNTNLKSLRVWQAGQTGNNLWVNENCDNSGHGVPGGGLEANAIDPTLFRAMPLPLAGIWYVTEVEVKQSSAQGVTDGYMTYIRNAVYMLDPAKRWTTIPNLFPSPWIQHALDQISNNVEPVGAKAITTWDYCDDSLARILWSPEPSYQNAYPTGTNYTRIPCIPSSWATAVGVSTITAFNRLGPNTDLVGQYLYVLDTNGVAYQIGQHT